MTKAMASRADAETLAPALFDCATRADLDVAESMRSLCLHDLRRLSSKHSDLGPLFREAQDRAEERVLLIARAIEGRFGAASGS